MQPGQLLSMTVGVVDLALAVEVRPVAPVVGAGTVGAVLAGRLTADDDDARVGGREFPDTAVDGFTAPDDARDVVVAELEAAVAPGSAGTVTTGLDAAVDVAAEVAELDDGVAGGSGADWSVGDPQPTIDINKTSAAPPENQRRALPIRRPARADRRAQTRNRAPRQDQPHQRRPEQPHQRRPEQPARRRPEQPGRRPPG